MSLLIDTSVLLRAFDLQNENYPLIRKLLRDCIDRRVRFVVTIQNMAEFRNVATRPVERNGQGLTSEQAKRRIALIERFCEVVAEDLNPFQVWKRIVGEHTVIGVAVHDARLVSVMISLGIKQILTLNERDFRRYGREGIQVDTPISLSATLSSS
jgi:predicted nucleic acid-binding protein